jgi:hypothetical protein
MEYLSASNDRASAHHPQVISVPIRAVS